MKCNSQYLLLTFIALLINFNVAQMKSRWRHNDELFTFWTVGAGKDQQFHLHGNLNARLFAHQYQGSIDETDSSFLFDSSFREHSRCHLREHSQQITISCENNWEFKLEPYPLETKDVLNGLFHRPSHVFHEANFNFWSIDQQVHMHDKTDPLGKEHIFQGTIQSVGNGVTKGDFKAQDVRFTYTSANGEFEWYHDAEYLGKWYAYRVPDKGYEPTGNNYAFAEKQSFDNDRKKVTFGDFDKGNYNVTVETPLGKLSGWLTYYESSKTGHVSFYRSAKQSPFIWAFNYYPSTGNIKWFKSDGSTELWISARPQGSLTATDASAIAGFIVISAFMLGVMMARRGL